MKSLKLTGVTLVGRGSCISAPNFDKSGGAPPPMPATTDERRVIELAWHEARRTSNLDAAAGVGSCRGCCSAASSSASSPVSGATCDEPVTSDRRRSTRSCCLATRALLGLTLWLAAVSSPLSIEGDESAGGHEKGSHQLVGMRRDRISWWAAEGIASEAGQQRGDASAAGQQRGDASAGARVQDPPWQKRNELNTIDDGWAFAWDFGLAFGGHFGLGVARWFEMRCEHYSSTFGRVANRNKSSSAAATDHSCCCCFSFSFRRSSARSCA